MSILSQIYNKVEIFTDGSCLGNPGPGGYGIILRYKQQKKELSAGYRLTTNNRMELMAAVVSLEALTKPCKVIFITDSQYLRYGITQWLQNWERRGWQTTKHKSVKNTDLWQRLNLATQPHILQWDWVKGHTNHLENERCDELARAAASNPMFEDIGYQVKDGI